MLDLAGKNILITGASRGLGAVMASVYAKLGARIGMIARSIERLERIRQSLPDSSAHVCLSADLLVENDLDRALSSIITQFENIDIVLHAAGGGLGMHDPLLSTSQLIQIFHLNVAAGAEVNRRIIPKMKERRSGTIIHVGSIASFEAHGSIAYNTVKAALAAYVRSLGRTLAGDQIVVTGILPGGFFGPENAMERFKENNPSEYERYLKEKVPRGALGNVDELVPLLLFLSSPTNSMMGGCMVPIDAGEGRAYSC